MHLVTGASGHIGNVLVRLLLQGGEKVRVLARTGQASPALRDLEVDLVAGDLLDRQALAAALRGVEVVHHLAARISITPGPNPEADRVNLGGTHLLLETLRSLPGGAPRLLYASSVYALRPPVSGVLDESCSFDPAAARGAYDRSKAAASLEVLRAASQGLDAVLLCPTAVAGPFDFRCSEAGRGILYNMTPGVKFTIDGAYDFVDVRDVAAGFLAAAARAKSGRVYILGGNLLTVREVAQTIWQTAEGWHFGIHLPDWVADLAAGLLPLFTETPIFTPYSLAAIRSNSEISHARAQAELGYAPRPAVEAIVDAVKWWLAQRGEEAAVAQPSTRLAV